MEQALTFGEAQAMADNATASAPPTEFSHDDYQLARRIAGGDMDAFAELYQQHYRRVYTLCLRMTRSVSEAEDLTQEIFIHVQRKIGGFRGHSSLTTWLYRVAYNKVLMHFRRSIVRHEQTTEDAELPQPITKEEATPGHVAEVNRLALDWAIAQLPPGYRAVFVLHDVEGYEHAEIARIARIAVGTSKSQLHKARMKLRQLLK